MLGRLGRLGRLGLCVCQTKIPMQRWVQQLVSNKSHGKDAKHPEISYFHLKNFLFKYNR
jgi:hypothetical protein